MPLTGRLVTLPDGSVRHELVGRVPDRHMLEWPGLTPFGALYAVDHAFLHDAEDLSSVYGVVSTGRQQFDRRAVWFCDPADRWWIHAGFALEDAYWWTLREVLWRRLGVIETNGLEVFSWRRHVYPLNPLRRLRARLGGR